jgi:hypothetical protein
MKQTVVISPHSINQLGLIMEEALVFCERGTESLKTMHVHFSDLYLHNNFLTNNS